MSNTQESSFEFGKVKIQNLPLPDKGSRVVYHDTRQQGLSIRLTHSGAKSFIVRRRVDGRPETITIGSFPELTVENARKAAQRIIYEIAKGHNPAKDKRLQRSSDNLDVIFERFLEKHVKAKLTDRTHKEYHRIFQIHLTSLYKFRLDEITYKQINMLHGRIGANNGHYVANRTIALLKKFFNWCVKNEGFEGNNPAAGIDLFPEYERERFLRAEELPAFFDSVALDESDTLRDYVLLSLLCGARKSNMQAMRWDQLDFNLKTWTIPKTKNKQPAIIPLVPAAYDILEKRKDNGSEWVFPSNSKSGHLSDPKRGWNRILERAGLKDLRIHDLRRSMGSWQAINHASLVVIAKSLGQSTTQAASIYARLSIDPVRDSMEQAARSMLEHDKARSGSNKKIRKIK